MQKQTFSAKALGNEYATGVSRPTVLTTKAFLPHQRVTTEGSAMFITVRVTENPNNIGNGFWEVGSVFEVVGETPCYYILSNNHRVNKVHLSIAGTACNGHSVKVEILNQVA
ncbi:hypothetical protein CDL31_06900 [Enterobacter kobei]|nr:hypothetical protein CDL31_06900 [Enterobacter kobei]